MMINLIRFVACVLCLMSSPAWAGRPFLTDDAGLTTPETCQIETWAQFNANHDCYLWALPACNPTGNLEITVGINQLQTHTDGNVDSYLLQGKTLLREREPIVGEWVWHLALFVQGMAMRVQILSTCHLAYLLLMINCLFMPI